MILDILLRFKKPLGIIALFFATLSAGYWYGVESVEPEIIVEKEILIKEVEKIVEIEKIVEVIKFVEKKDEQKDKTTIIVENPDGTKKTTITEKTKTKTESKSDKDKSSSSDKKTDKMVDRKDKQTPHVIYPKKPKRYRSGVFAASTTTELFNKDFSNLDYGITLGSRIVGPVWIDSTYQVRSKNLTLGASVEF